jgi:hypothetical protein
MFIAAILEPLVRFESKFQETIMNSLAYSWLYFMWLFFIFCEGSVSFYVETSYFAVYILTILLTFYEEILLFFSKSSTSRRKNMDIHVDSLINVFNFNLFNILFLQNR